MMVLILLLLFAGGYASISCLPVVCSSSLVAVTQRGNGQCDLGCMSQPCSFDSQAGGSDCLSECGKTCSVGNLGDGHCDSGDFYADCNTAVCGWDFGDCGYCAKDCIG